MYCNRNNVDVGTTKYEKYKSNNGIWLPFIDQYWSLIIWISHLRLRFKRYDKSTFCSANFTVLAPMWNFFNFVSDLEWPSFDHIFFWPYLHVVVSYIIGIYSIRWWNRTHHRLPSSAYLSVFPKYSYRHRIPGNSCDYWKILRIYSNFWRILRTFRLKKNFMTIIRPNNKLSRVITLQIHFKAVMQSRRRFFESFCEKIEDTRDISRIRNKVLGKSNRTTDGTFTLYAPEEIEHMFSLQFPRSVVRTWRSHHR